MLCLVARSCVLCTFYQPCHAWPILSSFSSFLCFACAFLHSIAAPNKALQLPKDIDVPHTACCDRPFLLPHTLYLYMPMPTTFPHPSPCPHPFYPTFQHLLPPTHTPTPYLYYHHLSSCPLPLLPTCPYHLARALSPLPALYHSTSFVCYPPFCFC